MRPEFLARRLTEAFGYDSIEALAQQNAATQQVAVDALGQALFGGGTMGGNGSSIGAALDASKTEETMQ